MTTVAASYSLIIRSLTQPRAALLDNTAPMPHILIDGADRYAPDALPPLPRLQRALQRWQPQPLLAQDLNAPLTPAETLRAQLLRVPGEPGHQPLAALAQGVANAGCAWLTPCHVQLNMDHAQLHDPEALQLGEDESRTLLDALAPLFADEGITLHFETPLRWFAQGDLLCNAHWVSLAQGMRHPLRMALLAPPSSRQPDAERRRLQRLLNEVQMLLYTHPLTDARAARRLPAVNAVWLHGAGSMDSMVPPSFDMSSIPIDTRLCDAANQGPQAWAAAWSQLDAELPDRLDALLAAGGADTPCFALCGDTGTLRFQPAPTGLGVRIARLLRPLNLPAQLAQLHGQDHAPGGRHAP